MAGSPYVRLLGGEARPLEPLALGRSPAATGTAICPPCGGGPGDLPALARVAWRNPREDQVVASPPRLALPLLSRRLGRATSCTINGVRSREAWP